MWRVDFHRGRTPAALAGLVLGVAVLTGCGPAGRRALTEGDRHLQAGRAAEAVPLLERAAKELQTDGQAWNHLGRAYQESGRPEEARKAYLKALQSDRNLFDAHFNLGQLALEAGAWREAEAGFRTWLGALPNPAPLQQPGLAGAWRGLGLAQLRQGNLNDAERSLGSAIRLDDHDSEAWNAVGVIRQQRRQYRDAFNTFAHAAKLGPQFAAPRLNAAVVAHQFLRDRRAALEYYRAYLALNPPDAAAITQLIAQLEANAAAQITPEPTGGSRAHGEPSVATVIPAARPVVPAPPVNPVVNPRPAEAVNVANTVAPAPLKSSDAPAPAPALARRAVPELTGPTTLNPPSPAARPASVPPPQPSPSTEPAPVAVAPPTRTSPPVALPVSVPAAVVSVASPTPLPPVSATVPGTPVSVAPTPPPTAPLPLEVVRIEERPTFRPARDSGPPVTPAPLATAPPVTSVGIPDPMPPNTATSPAGSTLEPAPGVVDPADPSIVESTAETSPKRSLWARANPVNWFRSSRPEKKTANEKLVTPLDFPAEPPMGTAQAPARPVVRREVAPAATPASPVRPVVAAAPVVTAGATPEPAVPRTPVAPPKPVFPRYVRQVTVAPAPGDRAAAEREFPPALAAHQRQDFATAEVGYRRVVASDPSYFEAQHNLSIAALALGDLPTALKAAETAAALRPESVSARYQFAVALQRSRHVDDAVNELEAITRLNTAGAASHLAAATLYANDLREPDLARPHYEQVLSLEPNHPQAETIRRWLVERRTRNGDR